MSLWVLALVVWLPIVSFSFAPVSAQNTIYVNATIPTDSAGCGAIDSPCSSIAYALGHVSFEGTIQLSAGNFNLSQSDINEPVIINGVPGSTFLNCPTGAAHGLMSTGTLTLYGLTFQNCEIAVFLNGGINSQITECNFTSNQCAVLAQDTANLMVISSLFQHNNKGAVVMGGEQHLVGASVVVIKDSNFTYNQGESGGALSLTSFSTQYNITGCTFENNQAVNWGGAIYLTNYSSINVVNSSLARNLAEAGGAIYVGDTSQLSVDRSFFDTNDADGGVSGQGGHIFVAIYCDLRITDSRLQGGTASGQGGAIYAVSSGSFSASNTNFSSNESPQTPGEGGALFLQALQTTVSLDNCVFDRNLGLGKGGAIYIFRTAATLTACNLTLNQGDQGGAVLAEDPGSSPSHALTLTDCSVVNNFAVTNGGAVYVEGIDVAISGSRPWEINSAAHAGGAIYQSGGTLQLNGITFYNNSANDNGGALFTLQAQVGVENTIFRGNLLSVHVENATMVTFSNCTFESNQGTGAAIDIKGATISVSKSTFSGNNVVNSGLPGPTIQSDSSVLEIFNSTFDGNVGNNGAVISFFNNSNVELTSVNFLNNNAGDGLLNALSSALTVNTCLFKQNIATHGSAVYAVNTSAHFNATDFISNTATGGSVIYVQGPESVSVSLVHCQFETNSNQVADGGAIMAHGTSVSITTCNFSYNTAPTNGGAIFLDQSNLYAESNAFVGNQALIGSAIYLDFSTATLLHANFSQNVAQQSGALAISNTSSATISGGIFSLNQAIVSGGAIVNSGNITVQTNSQFTSNKAVFGGAIQSLNGSSTTISDTTFSLNSVFGDGGAIYATSAIIHITDAEFDGNYAQDSGGAVFTSGANVMYTSATFSSNQAQNMGGAIFSQNSDWYAQSGSAHGNSAQKGGVAYVEHSNFSYFGVSLFGNTGRDGAAVYFTQAAFNIFECNISSNVASSRGGGITAVNSASGQISYSHFSLNQGGNIFLESAVTIKNSTITQGTSRRGMGDGIYINSSSAEMGLRVSNTTLTNSSPYTFCCGNIALSEMTNALCNYPSCNSKDCGGTDGSCNCPSNLPPTFSCTCKDPLYYGAFCNLIDQCGDPDYCTNGSCSYDNFTHIANCADINNCINVTCPAGQYCVDLPFHYFCNPCPHGQASLGGVCVDACLVHNGYCDYHVECTSGPTCGPCPVGFVGNGSTQCIAQCGNGSCDAGIGENCVTCPLDCYNNTACGVCGDHFCQAQKDETCSTCPEDCGLCAVTPCIPSDCSQHGTCKSGICVCNNPWGGPACDKDNSPIDLNFTSGGGVKVSPGNLGVSFLLTIASIVEQDTSGRSVDFLNITNQNYTFSLYNTTNQNGQPTSSSDFGACSDCDLPFYVRTVGSSGNRNQMYRYNVTLENGAYLEFMIWQFLDDTSQLSFANETTEYFANSFKLALQLRAWPFKNLRNTLAIILDAKASEEKVCSAVKSNQDENNNLKWYTLNVKGVTLYGQFLNRAIVDGLFRSVSFSLNPDRSVTATLPHFWENLVLDPSFSVLVGSEDASCTKSNKVNKKLIEILVPILFVLTVAVVVFILMYPKLKSWRKIHKGRQQLVQTDSTKDTNIEMIKSMEVHSAAGNFNVQL